MEQFLGKTLFQSPAQGGQKLATHLALSPSIQAVGILFLSSHCQPSLKFCQKLMEAYEEVNGQGAKIFEVVIASGDTEEDAYQQTFQAMPWLSLGFRSK